MRCHELLLIAAYLVSSLLASQPAAMQILHNDTCIYYNYSIKIHTTNTQENGGMRLIDTCTDARPEAGRLFVSSANK